MSAKKNHYDVFIIGAGQAGVPLAYELAKAGWRVGLAEQDRLGGSCVNFGCTPSKAVISSARLAHLARRGSDFGIHIPALKIDFAAVIQRARDIAQQSRHSLQQGFSEADNPALHRAHAELAGREGPFFKLRLDQDSATAERVVLNTGTQSAIPPIDGIDTVPYLHSGNWLDNQELPNHLVIIGGGYIGLEMAQFFRRMGSRVTVIESESQIAQQEDEDVATALQELLEAENIEFRLNTRVNAVEQHGEKIRLSLSDIGPSQMQASHIFLATGRRPNTAKLGLDTVGVETDSGGFVKTNDRLLTTVDNIWAAGDIRGGPMFTHTSYHDYRVIAAEILNKKDFPRDKPVPYAVFTDPELGRVGVTEREARQAGRNFQTTRFDMKKNGKAIEMGETAGFIKVLIDPESEKILGAVVLAAEGGELIHIYADLMMAGVPFTAIRDAIHVHPTLAEAVQSAVAAV